MTIEPIGGAELLILESLADGAKHGYLLTLDIERRHGRRLGPGTLYAALGRLEARRLIRALEAEDRRHPYELTDEGAGVLTATLDDMARFSATGLGRLREADRMKALLRLYPRAWRDRHEVEVARMLDDSGSGLGDAPDLIRGAIDAHIHPAQMGLPPGRIHRWSTLDHLGGLAAFAGGVALVTAWSVPTAITVLGLWPGLWDLASVLRTGGATLTALAFSLVTLAVIALSTGHHEGWRPRILGPVAILLMAAMALVIDRYLLRSLSEGRPWIYIGIHPVRVFLVGSILAAVAMWDRAPVSRRSLALLAGTGIAAWLPLATQMWLLTSVNAEFAGPVVAVAWLALGWSAMRRRSSAISQKTAPTASV